MLATMTSKGQITLPAEIRQQLGIHPGDRLDFIIHADGRLEVIPVSGTVKDLKGFLPKPKKPLTLSQIEGAIRKGALR